MSRLSFKGPSAEVQRSRRRDMAPNSVFRGVRRARSLVAGLWSLVGAYAQSGLERAASTDCANQGPETRDQKPCDSKRQAADSQKKSGAFAPDENSEIRVISTGGVRQRP